MKKIILSLFLLFAPAAFAQNVVVSGSLQNIAGVPPSTNYFFRLRLRNYTGTVPKVNGVAVILPDCPLIHDICKDFTPNTSGVVSGTIYGNDQISPPGTYYTGEYWFNGKIPFSCDYLVTGTSFNFNTNNCLSSASPIGPTSIINQSFICSNGTPSLSWTCTHNLNDPNVEVSVYNLSGNQIYPDTLTVTSANVVTITFTTAQAGLAVILHAGPLVLSSNQSIAVLQQPSQPQTINAQPLTLNGPLNANGGITTNGMTASNLTPGQCVQAGTGGLLVPSGIPCGGGSSGINRTQIFNSSGVFTIPAGVTGVKVTLVGGGGAGGGSSGGTNYGDGGGSGGAAIKWLSALTPGNTLTVTVGAGGSPVTAASGGAFGSSAGGNGGTSSVASGTQIITSIIANGGFGGLCCGGGISGGAAGAAVGSGGDINLAGNAGGITYVNTASANGIPAPLLSGGNTVGVFNGNGNPGGIYGGGGSGGQGVGPFAGGAGGQGVVIFEWVQ